jgi:hypothetical protein
VTNTFWEAVKISLWDFQPHTVDAGELEASDATLGTREKLDVLAERIHRDALRWPHEDPIRFEPAKADFCRRPRG